MIICSPVIAEEEKDRDYIQPLQEVFQSDLVFPQDEGEVQFTFSPRFRNGKVQNFIQVPLEIEYGVTDNFQLEVGGDLFLDRNPKEEKSTHGVGDFEVGFMYSFMNINDQLLHFSFGADLGIPVGDVDNELGEGFIEYEPFIILAKDIPEWNYTQIFLQMSLGIVDRVKFEEADENGEMENEEPEADEFSLNAGFYVPIEQWRYTMEFNWKNNEWNNGGKENEMFLTPGLVYSLPDTWEFGIAAPIGLNQKSEDFRIIGQFIFEFDT